MPNLAQIMYDEPRRWIKRMRERNIDWAEIEYGRRNDYAGLQDFLEEQTDINFWPEMSITDWQQLVQSQKNAEERVDDRLMQQHVIHHAT